MDAITAQFLKALSQDQILATIPSGVFLVDNDRRIVSWNREAERITGYRADEVVGKHCSFLEGIECGNICGLFDEGSPEKPIIGSECRIRTKSGEEIILSKNVDFLYSNGRIIGGIESFIDISQLKHQEEQLQLYGEKLEETVATRTDALQKERSRLRAVLDGMPDPAYIVSQDFRLKFLNKPMEKLIGECAGNVCYEVIQGQARPCANCPWSKVKKGHPVNEERKFGRDNRVYEIIHTPVNDAEGEFEKLAVCRDITERKEAADRLQEANKQLDSFAHTVSHDLRSPLTGILCYSELIKDNYTDVLKDEGLELISGVENQGHRMLNIINDMLSFATADKIETVGSAVDTNIIVSQVLLDNQFEIDKKKVSIEIDDLPEVYVPEGLLYEVMSNLVVNALKYGCEDGGNIEIMGKKDKDCNAVTVIDHGQGIPEKEKASVFNVFVRGTSSENTQGTGIGLATVFKIMDKLNGKIMLEETDGGGCTFTAMFPRHIENELTNGFNSSAS